MDCYGWTKCWSILVLCIHLVSNDELPTCQPKDFQYAFTECDDFGGRWRVSVPASPEQCTGGAPNAPKRIDSCSTSCDAGSFYNSSSLMCEQCSPGYYSLGGGLKISAFNWTTLHEYGFRNSTEPRNSTECKGWIIKDLMLESTDYGDYQSGCISVISYTVRVVKRGKLQFKYQYKLPDDYSTILFTFQYRNYEDTEERILGPAGIDSYNIKFPRMTREQQKWNTMELPLLKPGLYNFLWKSVLLGNLRRSGHFYAKRDATLNQPFSLDRSAGVIRIKSVEIYGIAYASKCSPCEPGTFADQLGLTACKLCPRNTYSQAIASTECIPCNPDTHYSAAGSQMCNKKPKCTKDDYYEVQGECDEHTKKQRVTAKWIEPKICRGDNTTIAYTRYKACNLNSSEHQIDIACSPGMTLSNSTCKFCPENHFTNGSMQSCEMCPPSSLPQYSLVLNKWYYPLAEEASSPAISTQCVFENSDYNLECDLETPAWQTTPAIHSYIRSASNAMLNAYLLVTLAVDGFTKLSGGELEFTFETVCPNDDNCHFLFVETKGQFYSQTSAILKEWKGSTNGRKRYFYKVKQNMTISFTWVFKREIHLRSHARIYEIRLTNALGSGAVSCNPCVEGSEARCVLCPKGQYLSFETQHISLAKSHTHITKKICLQCPENYVINKSLVFPVGRERSCIKCGPSLKSNADSTECFSDCMVRIDGENYDLTKIQQPLFMKGAHLFTSGGTQYYHFFNITLCGKQTSTCTSNITSSSSSSNSESLEDLPEVVESLVCRMTIVPDPVQSYTTQPVPLGDTLIGITKEKEFQGIKVHPEFGDIKSDLHLYYITESTTVACKKGRTLVVTLRCAPGMSNENVVTAPTKCSDGTCDGCNFNFLVKTDRACRICNDSDYDVVVGECSNGFQEIHYINPRACIIPQNSGSLIRRRVCSAIPRQVQLGIMIISALGVVLLALVFHFWKKNRRLEYKYSKLVENKNSADCCAEDEDEDDEDDEEIKIRQPRKEKIDTDDGYETIHLTKQTEDDVL